MATIISFPRGSKRSAVGTEIENRYPDNELELSLLLSTLQADLVFVRTTLVELQREINSVPVPRVE